MIRFNNIGPHRHSWLSSLVAIDCEEIIKEIKRRHFCPECGESYPSGTRCLECDVVVVPVWPYGTPPDLWYDSTKGRVWLRGSEPKGTFEAAEDEIEAVRAVPEAKNVLSGR